MRITGEQKLGATLLIVGLVVIVFSQKEIEKVPHAFVHVRLAPNHARWKPLEYIIVECPVYLIHIQIVGVIVSTAGFTILFRNWLRVLRKISGGREMTKRSHLKCQVIGFCTGVLVAMGFTVLGLKIDIKIISIYDCIPWGISFMLILLIVGLLVGWKVETITTRELIRRNAEGVR